MPTRQGGCFLKKGRTRPRLNRRRTIAAPSASTPWTRKPFFARSTPIWHVPMPLGGSRPLHQKRKFGCREWSKTTSSCRDPATEANASAGSSRTGRLSVSSLWWCRKVGGESEGWRKLLVVETLEEAVWRHANGRSRGTHDPRPKPKSGARRSPAFMKS